MYFIYIFICTLQLHHVNKFHINWHEFSIKIRGPILSLPQAPISYHILTHLSPHFSKPLMYTNPIPTHTGLYGTYQHNPEYTNFGHLKKKTYFYQIILCNFLILMFQIVRLLWYIYNHHSNFLHKQYPPDRYIPVMSI